MPDKSKPAISAWTGYAFALIVTGTAIVFRFEVDQLSGTLISLPLCGLAVMCACIWRVGLGPALLAAVTTTAWYAWDLGASSPNAWIHCALYLGEAGVFCFYSRQLRIARDRAAQGEDWQRHLVQTAGEGIWMIDPDGIISYANPRMAEILGCGVEQIQGRTVEAFLFAEDLPAERIRFQNCRVGIREQYDRRLRRTDGSEIWTLACSSPYAPREKDAGVLTMMTDITERKRAEHALRRSERKFRELFENIREGVYQTSPDGRILAANPELLRMLGFSNQEELNIVGVVRDTFVDADLHQNLRDRLESDGSYANVEFQLRTRDHRIITVRENARVVRDENGAVLYYEGTLTDISGELRLDRQLRQAQKMEALGGLAGGIARDFHSIGGAMMTGLQQAVDALPADSPARPCLDSVAGWIRSADALTRQILDFSRRQAIVENGRNENAASIGINALVIDLEPLLRRLVNPETSLDLALCPDPTPILADSGHIRQILTRFVIGARGCGGADRIELTTAVETNGPAASFVSLSVRGITAHAAPSGSAGANGNDDPWVGMATSQAILAQYGGTMTVAVEPATAESSRGVRYALCLPIAAGTHVETRSVPDSATILLVEEEPLIRELSRDMLERQGFLVLSAGSAAEAGQIARGPQSFDVLITAWGENSAGGETAALIQALRGTRPELPVLLIAELSGSSDQDLNTVPAHGKSAILWKPFSGEVLGRKVRQLLEEQSLQRAD